MRKKNIISLSLGFFTGLLRFPDAKSSWNLKLNSNLSVGREQDLQSGYPVGAPYAERLYEKSDFTAAGRCAA